MTLFKIFTSTFDEEMMSRGFKRKGWLYYRLHGEILQGVTLKTTTPYEINFYFVPYWMESFSVDTGSLDKRYWAENGVMICPSFSSRYKKENVQLNQDFMSVCFDIAKKHVLPVMDKINCLDAYLEHCVPNWCGFDDERLGKRILKFNYGKIDSKYSHLDALFDPKITILWHIWDSMFIYQPFLKHAIKKNDIIKGYDLLCDKFKLLDSVVDPNLISIKKYQEYMTEDGLERAKKLINGRITTMKQRLKDELGLEVDIYDSDFPL